MKICPTCQRRFPDNTLRCPEDSTALVRMSGPAPTRKIIGRRLFGEYTVVQMIGEGGMGAVYLAQQDTIDQKIALKILHGTTSPDDELLHRFVREAKAVSTLNHPNIIKTFIFGRTDDGLIYLAMEYIRGRSLGEVMESSGPMDELRAIRIMKQALSAVGQAHSMGIIHRDLKPDNLLLTTYEGEEDFVKVLDFGIAKVVEPDDVAQRKLTQAGVVYGTPEYLSPEQAQAKELDGRSDVYSLGVLLYEMITGDVPFNATNAVQILRMHVYDQIPSPREKLPSVCPEMELIILKAMSKRPQDRFANAREFFNALVQRERDLCAQTGRSSLPINLPGSEMLLSGERASGSRKVDKSRHLLLLLIGFLGGVAFFIVLAAIILIVMQSLE